jgi:GAF domain-containing protein
MEGTPSSSEKEAVYVVDDWPMNVEATRKELKKAQKRLERYQAALRLADVEIKRRNRSIVALTTFAYQASHSASPPNLLKLALVQALETSNAPVGAILLVDADTKELTLGVHKGLTPELMHILTGQQLGRGATALMPHLVAGASALLEYDTSDDEAERELLKTGQLTSLVSLSLQIGPRLIGALLIGLQKKRHFTPAELCFLMAMSQETAVAMESLRLREGLWITAETLLGGGSSVELQEFEETELKNTDISTPLAMPDMAPPSLPEPAADDLEHLLAAMMEAEDEVQQQNTDLQTLNNISEMINSTLDLKEILQCTVSETQNTLKTDAAWLYLIDERKQLELSAHTGLSLEYVRGMQFIKVGSSIEGRVVTENKASFVESVTDDVYGHKIWVDKEQLQALAAVPITRPLGEEHGQAETKVIGVLAVGKKKDAYLWTPREVRLLTSIANQVAPAIDNARLYSKVQEGEVGLRTGNEILQEINDMLLEKNANLEDFIHSDLGPALTMATQVLNSLTDEMATLNNSQQRNVNTLQKIMNRLNELAKETSIVSATLDSEFGKVLDSEEKKSSFGSVVKPLRLEKKLDVRANLEPEPEKKEDIGPPAKTLENKTAVNLAPMSFEDAVAAGLVPPGILDRESKPKT